MLMPKVASCGGAEPNIVVKAVEQTNKHLTDKMIAIVCMAGVLFLSEVDKFFKHTPY